MSKKFIIMFMSFAILLLLINFVLDKSFKAFSVHNLLNEKLDEQFAEYDDTLKYLFMGNSHNTVNTYILENSFNYSSPSENYIQSYYKFKHIVENLKKKPEYLFIQSDLSSFGPKISNRYEYNSYWIKYIDYIELAKVKKSRSILLKWLEGAGLSYAGNYKDIQLSILYRLKMKDVVMFNGYIPPRDFKNYGDNANKEKTAWNKAQIILSKDAYFDESIRYYFTKMLQLCQQHQVKVVLVKFPLTREYNKEEREIVPADKLQSEIDAIASSFSVYQCTLDYHAIFFDHPDYFFDPDHLNIKGADLFTERLAKDLRALDLKVRTVAIYD